MEKIICPMCGTKKVNKVSDTYFECTKCSCEFHIPDKSKIQRKNETK